jgi:hypothetical protein
MDLKRKKEHGIYSSKCVAQRNVSGSPFFLNVDAYVSFSKKKIAHAEMFFVSKRTADVGVKLHISLRCS